MLFSIIFLFSISSANADTPSSSTVSTSPPKSQSSLQLRNLPPIKQNQHPNGNRHPSKVTIPKYENNHSGHCLDDILCEENQGKLYQPEHNPTQKKVIQPKVKWKSHIFRLYLLNVNGISLGNDAADLTDVFLQMENIREEDLQIENIRQQDHNFLSEEQVD